MPNRYSKDKNEREIESWCGHQKNNKKLGKLTEEQIKKLENIKEWKWSEGTIQTFDDRVKDLDKFVKRNDMLPLASSKDENEHLLSVWCGHQRQYKKKGTLVNEQIKSLEKIKYWYWSDENKKMVIKTFDENYKDLVKYIELNKKLPDRSDNGKRLNAWFYQQKKKFKCGKLKNEEINKMKFIQGWK